MTLTRWQRHSETQSEEEREGGGWEVKRGGERNEEEREELRGKYWVLFGTLWDIQDEISSKQHSFIIHLVHIYWVCVQFWGPGPQGWNSRGPACTNTAVNPEPSWKPGEREKAGVIICFYNSYFWNIKIIVTSSNYFYKIVGCDSVNWVKSKLKE